MLKINYRFGRINDNRVEFAPNPLIINGVNYSTNDAEIYREQGYYPIECTEKPVEDGFYFVEKWELEGDKVVQKWIKHEILSTDEISDEEFVSMLEEVL